jgi:hypothetical protein
MASPTEKKQKKVLGKNSRLERLAARLAQIDAKLRSGTRLTKKDLALLRSRVL